MRLDGGELHIGDSVWPSRYRYVCCTDWSPDGTRLTVTLIGDRGQKLGIVDLDVNTGQVRRMTELDVAGVNPGFARWSPDGRFLIYNASDETGSDLWIADANGRGSRKLASLSGTESVGAWRAQPLAFYFIKDSKAIWRMAMNADGTPAGPPRVWLGWTGLSLGPDSLDISRDGERVITTVSRRGSDLWLVERAKR